MMPGGQQQQPLLRQQNIQQQQLPMQQQQQQQGLLIQTDANGVLVRGGICGLLRGLEILGFSLMPMFLSGPIPLYQSRRDEILSKPFPNCHPEILLQLIRPSGSLCYLTVN